MEPWCSLLPFRPPLTGLPPCRGAWRVPPPPAEVRALYARMPAFLEAALLPFQREGVLFGLARAGRCLIADEVGASSLSLDASPTY